jgi:tetratricopeptide (TPR) repeat protein
MNRAERRRQKKLPKKTDQSTATGPTDFAKAEQALQSGVSAHQAGQLEAAIHWYGKTLEVQPDNAEVLCNLGAALLEVGRFSEAETVQRQAIASRPDYPDAHYNLALALKEQKGTLEEIIDCLKKTISLQPDHVDANNNLRFMLNQLNSIEEAIEFYKQEIVSKPDFPDIYYNLGTSLTSHGKSEEAIVNFKTAISLNPNYADAYCGLGKAFTIQARFDDAASSYRAVYAVCNILTQNKKFSNQKNVYPTKFTANQ